VGDVAVIGQTVRLVSDHARKIAAELAFKAPHGSVANFRPPTRTVDQNSLLWSLLSEVSRAKPDGRTHTPDIWKCLFMQACGHAVQFETGLDGAPFPLGFRSSRLTKAQMTDLIEFILQYCAEKGIETHEEAA
jgi:hypothetical protein